MGVNATFQADFSTFLSAVQQADVALADFGKGAETVEKKLNNMVDRWSGRQVIQQANELVVAIDKVGGATTLTTSEQAKLNATLTEAIAKYHAIGETVPPEMQQLADQTKQVATSQHDLVGSLNSVAAAFGVAFTLDRFVAYQTQILSNASALNDLSQQTHINIEDLQVLTAATSSYGVSGEELGRALFTLRSRIAGGDQSVASAYAQMGISIDEIKGKNAYELFLTTERGLASLGEGIRETAAADLYGGKLGASMAGFSTGVDEAIDKAKQFNYIASTESVKALAEYNDAIKRAKDSIGAFVTEIEGRAAQGFNVLTDAVDKGATTWQLFKAGYLDWFGAQTGLISSTAHLATLLDHLNIETDKNTKATNAATGAHKEAAVALTEEAQAAVFMDTLKLNAAKPLTEWQIRDLDILRQRNELTSQNAAALGVNAQQLDVYKAKVEASTKAIEAEKKAIADADQIAFDSYSKRIKSLEALTQQSLKAYSFEGQIGQLEALKKAEEDLARSVYEHIDSEKTRMKILEDLTAKRAAIEAQETALQQKQAQRVNAAVTAELDAQAKILAAYGQNVDGTVRVENAQAQLQQRLDALHATKVEGISQYQQEQALMADFLSAQEAEIAATQQATAAKQEKARATDDETRSVRELHGQLTMLVSDARIPEYFGSLLSGQSSVARTVAAGGRYTPGEAAFIASGGILSGSIGGGNFRAAGGPVEAGAPYIVGERGPELFVPSRSGSIVPNGGGGVVINAPIYVNGTAADVARQVAAELLRTVKAGAQLAGA